MRHRHGLSQERPSTLPSWHSSGSSLEHLNVWEHKYTKMIRAGQQNAHVSLRMFLNMGHTTGILASGKNQRKTFGVDALNQLLAEASLSVTFHLCGCSQCFSCTLPWRKTWSPYGSVRGRGQLSLRVQGCKVMSRWRGYSLRTSDTKKGFKSIEKKESVSQCYRVLPPSSKVTVG